MECLTERFFCVIEPFSLSGNVAAQSQCLSGDDRVAEFPVEPEWKGIAATKLLQATLQCRNVAAEGGRFTTRPGQTTSDGGEMPIRHQMFGVELNPLERTEVAILPGRIDAKHHFLTFRAVGIV